jgi:uncharacterized protein (DUF1499 family)
MLAADLNPKPAMPTLPLATELPSQPRGAVGWLQRLTALLAPPLALILSLTLILQAPGGAQASLFHLEGPPPTDLGLGQAGLSPCPSPAHCARENWVVADPGAALERLLPAVLALEGVQIVETGGGYLHATASSRIFGFVDDLELHAAPQQGVIEARSISRLGDSDLGVNARRLATLRRALAAV